MTMDSLLSTEDARALAALRQKYKEERDRRVREDGNSQYRDMRKDYPTLLDDPFVDSPEPREPLNDFVEVAIVGGGFAGLLTGVRLRDAGVSDFRILDAGGDFGGTWYWNRYPGCQCDIDSYCYLPLLEELEWIPEDKYAYAPEIHKHCQRIAQAYDLYDKAVFHTHVTDLSWDESGNSWTIRTNRGDAIRARFVVLGTGPFSHPKLPAIPGIDEFSGHIFHTSRWDYSYTGGTHEGGLVGLADKRVGIIGTGCTAIQCIPHLAEHAQHLFVFQRTPSGVDRRGNKKTDPKWASDLRPGWQAERRKNFNEVVSGKEVKVDLVNDGWGDIYRTLYSLLPEAREKLTPEQVSELAELADMRKMDELRARVDEVVKDTRTAEILKAWYRQYCKRPTFSDDYLPTFNRKNVTLVDTSSTGGVESIHKNGISTGGQEYELDCIILSTGFEVGTLLTRRAGFELLGEGSRTLSEYWSDGVKTFHGFHVNGFPNCFVLGPSQKGVSVNYTSIIDDQATHVAHIISRLKQLGASRVEAKPEAVAEWVATIRRLAIDNLAYFDACTPGYYNNEGHIATRGGGLTDEAYGPGANAFSSLIKTWREDGNLSGLDIR